MSVQISAGETRTTNSDVSLGRPPIGEMGRAVRLGAQLMSGGSRIAPPTRPLETKRKLRYKRIVRVFVVLVVSLAAGGAVSGVAHAAAGSCRTTDAGCTRHYLDSSLQYRFGSSDENVDDNYYNCPGSWTFQECAVAFNFGAIRINSASYVRMCVYANQNYANALYWVTTHGIWATTDIAGWSLRYRTSASC